MKAWPNKWKVVSKLVQVAFYETLRRRALYKGVDTSIMVVGQIREYSECVDYLTSSYTHIASHA